MDLPRSRALASVLEYLTTAESTNDELVHRVGEAPDAWPDRSVVVTDDQTAGRGRLGRVWTAPAGRCLAVSVLVRPRISQPGLADGAPLPLHRFAWLSLLAGLAATRAVATIVSEAHATAAESVAADSADAATPRPEVELKWPNDVLIDGRKVCGILSELLPDASGAVVGAGFNLSLTQAELPVDTATSLALAGVAHPEPDAVLAAYLGEFFAAYRRFLAAGGDPELSGLRADVTRVCGTVGRRVRVELPAEPGDPGRIHTGVATELDPDGRLVVSQNGDRLSVAAGDVTHLRY